MWRQSEVLGAVMRRWFRLRGTLCWLTLIGLISTALANAEQLPLEDFIRHGDYLDLKLSPDAKHLVARARNRALSGCTCGGERKGGS